MHFQESDIGYQPNTDIPAPIGDGRRIVNAGNRNHDTQFSLQFDRNNTTVPPIASGHSAERTSYVPLFKEGFYAAESHWTPTPFFDSQAVAFTETTIERDRESTPPYEPISDWNSPRIQPLRLRNDGRRVVSQSCEPQITWHGRLPRSNHKNQIYSVKTFIGGVPWDITESELKASFGPYGLITVEWPGKSYDHAKHPPQGYAYLIFDSSASVKNLLQHCRHTADDEYYLPVSSHQRKNQDVQVIPWIISDGTYNVTGQNYRTDFAKTVFVGGLHGMITAAGLWQIMESLFDGVCYAGIDTDPYKYPIGSGRVTFDNQQSYRKAIEAGFVQVRTKKFNKKIQIDPYLHDTPCNQCQKVNGPWFCRESQCWAYYCESCWYWHHSPKTLRDHKPMMRISNKAKHRINAK